MNVNALPMETHQYSSVNTAKYGFPSSLLLRKGTEQQKPTLDDFLSLTPTKLPTGGSMGHQAAPVATTSFSLPFSSVDNPVKHMVSKNSRDFGTNYAQDSNEYLKIDTLQGKAVARTEGDAKADSDGSISDTLTFGAVGLRREQSKMLRSLCDQQRMHPSGKETATSLELPKEEVIENNNTTISNQQMQGLHKNEKEAQDIETDTSESISFATGALKMKQKQAKFKSKEIAQVSNLADTQVPLGEGSIFHTAKLHETKENVQIPDLLNRDTPTDNSKNDANSDTLSTNNKLHIKQSDSRKCPLSEKNTEVLSQFPTVLSTHESNAVLVERVAVQDGGRTDFENPAKQDTHIKNLDHHLEIGETVENVRNLTEEDNKKALGAEATPPILNEADADSYKKQDSIHIPHEDVPEHFQHEYSTEILGATGSAEAKEEVTRTDEDPAQDPADELKPDKISENPLEDPTIDPMMRKYMEMVLKKREEESLQQVQNFRNFFFFFFCRIIIAVGCC